MSKTTSLVIWLIGLLGCSIPIVIIFASYMFPETGFARDDITLSDVARQTYPNILFVVIAISAIVIAEALMLFFRMVETGEAKVPPALWLLCMVPLIVFSSISYARVVLGGDFDPLQVSSQQLWTAYAGAVVAVIAALMLRRSVLEFEQIAREAVHENAVLRTLEDLRKNRNDPLDVDVQVQDVPQFPSSMPEKKEEKVPAMFRRPPRQPKSTRKNRGARKTPSSSSSSSSSSVL